MPQEAHETSCVQFSRHSQASTRPHGETWFSITVDAGPSIPGPATLPTAVYSLINESDVETVYGTVVTVRALTVRRSADVMDPGGGLRSPACTHMTTAGVTATWTAAANLILCSLMI